MKIYFAVTGSQEPVYLPENDTMLKREVNMTPKLREAFPPKARTY